MSAGGVGL